MESDRAHPKEIRAPPMKELMKSLSIRILAFLAPMRETSSVVWAGVKASIEAVSRRDSKTSEIDGVEQYRSTKKQNFVAAKTYLYIYGALR